MFMVMRSLPPYPISMTLRASGSLIFPLSLASPRGAAQLALPSLHRRMGGGQEDDRLHVGEQPHGLADERLPVGILAELGARGGTLVEILEDPHVHDLVELRDLGRPHADAPHELRAHGQDVLEEADPLPAAAGLRAV